MSHISNRPKAIGWLALPVCLGLFTQVEVARGATFAVSPVQLTLGPSSPSALLTLRNQGSQPTRLQLSAMVWRQTADGKMQFEPTEDVVYFPAMLVLAPGESRSVRVGAVRQAGELERTYRVFVEELPPLERVDDGVENGVHVLTRMGIPVFVEPAAVHRSAALRNARVHEGRVSLEVHNTGNVHFRIRGLRFIGRDEKGVRFNHVEPGWYVLAGGQRDYEVALPPGACAGLRSLTVSLEAEAAAETTLVVNATACAP